MKYLLDANIISALVIDPRGKVAVRLEEAGQANVFTSVIVNAEVAFGVRKKGSAELAQKVGNVVKHLYVAPFAPPADAKYAEVRADLERRGKLIGPNDLLIAAHTLALEAVLVTDDRAFAAVPGLKIENWLRP